MIKNWVLALLLLIALTGCYSHNGATFASVSDSDKVVSVPPGYSGLNGEVKNALQAKGWQLVVGDVVPARYQLVLRYEAFDSCLLSPAIAYEISMVDRRTGQEVLAMAGKGCQDSAVKEFVVVLEKLTT